MVNQFLELVFFNEIPPKNEISLNTEIHPKQCWLCEDEEPSLELYNCCNHYYCEFHFSEHNIKFHTRDPPEDIVLTKRDPPDDIVSPKRDPPENTVFSETRKNTNDNYTVSDPTNYGVMRYSFGKKIRSREEKLQKELEDGYRW
jgi:hypothetical protein